MTVQEIGDEFTVLSHQGKAQARVVHVSGGEVKNVTGIEMIGDDIALIKSETIRNQDAESAEIINEKLKIDVWKFVEKKNPDYKKDVIKHQTLVSLLIEFTAKREEELKANFDYFIEGKDLEIKTLGERCNQLLKDKGDLTDKIEKMQKKHKQEILDLVLSNSSERAEFEKENAVLERRIERAKECMKKLLFIINSDPANYNCKGLVQDAEDFIHNRTCNIRQQGEHCISETRCIMCDKEIEK